MTSVRLVPFLFLLSGCVASNGANPFFYSSVEETKDRNAARLELDLPRFLFTAPGNSFSGPPDDPRSEQMRIGWLEHHLRANEACTAGYDIASRQMVKKDAGEDYFFEVVYRGVCKP